MPFVPPDTAVPAGIVSFRTRPGEQLEIVDVRVDDASTPDAHEFPPHDVPPFAVGWSIHKETARQWAKLLVSAADKRDELDAAARAERDAAGRPREGSS